MADKDDTLEGLLNKIKDISPTLKDIFVQAFGDAGPENDPVARELARKQGEEQRVETANYVLGLVKSRLGAAGPPVKIGQPAPPPSQAPVGVSSDVLTRLGIGLQPGGPPVEPPVVPVTPPVVPVTPPVTPRLPQSPQTRLPQSPQTRLPQSPQPGSLVTPRLPQSPQPDSLVTPRLPQSPQPGGLMPAGSRLPASPQLSSLGPRGGIPTDAEPNLPGGQSRGQSLMAKISQLAPPEVSKMLLQKISSNSMTEADIQMFLNVSGNNPESQTVAKLLRQLVYSPQGGGGF